MSNRELRGKLFNTVKAMKKGGNLPSIHGKESALFPGTLVKDPSVIDSNLRVNAKPFRRAPLKPGEPLRNNAEPYVPSSNIELARASSASTASTASASTASQNNEFTPVTRKSRKRTKSPKTRKSRKNRK